MEEREKQEQRSLPPGQGVSFFIQGESERLFGIVDDVRGEEMGLTVEGYFAPGVMLEVTLEEDEQETYFIGEVKWCEPDEWLEGTYHMGVVTRIKMVT